jgi:cold shock CspA family protein
MTMSTIHTGTVKFYNVGRTYGFIVDCADDREYFCHNDDIIDHIKKNDKVTFEIIDYGTKTKAINVRRID